MTHESLPRGFLMSRRTNRIEDNLSSGRRLILAVATTVAVVGIETAPLVRAQSAGDNAPTEFEVASIRPAAVSKAGGEGSKRSRIEYSPNSLTMRNVNLAECVQWAYSVEAYQVSGPAALNPERYDIRAKAEVAVPISQLKAMAQDLLAKRFSLALHREMKVLPVFELVLAKGGPKLPPPKADSALLSSHSTESLPRVENGSFVFQDVSIPEFAEKLSVLRGVDGPVVDRTGIKGVFDITLNSAASAILQPDGPSILTLLQEQLGLRAISAKAPIENLVIDHVGKPSGN